MEDLSNFIQSVSALAEMTAIFYSSLVETGLSEGVAVELTARMIGEVINAGGSKQKEDEQ
mgnify:FL=1